MSQLPKPNPRCSCCGDAYDTRWLCARCRRDPANAEWVEGREDITENDHAASSDRRPEWGEQRPWKPTKQFCEVVGLLVDGVTHAEIARRAGCSERFVEKVADEVGLARARPSLGASPRPWLRDLLVRLRDRRRQEPQDRGDTPAEDAG